MGLNTISGCVNGFLWGVQKTVATPTGLIKANKLINIINAYALEVFPKLADIKLVSVYYNRLNKPGQPMLETLSAWLSFFPVLPKYKAYQAAHNERTLLTYLPGGAPDFFKVNIDLFKSILGCGAECCTAYIAERKIGTTDVSPLGIIANGFGSVPFLAKVCADKIKNGLFLGIAFCDFVSIGKQILDGTVAGWINPKWQYDFASLSTSSYAVLTDSKTLLTVTGNVAKVWLVLRPPQWKALELGLAVAASGTGYAKYLITPLKVNL
jgi:hypothetical protein